LPKNKRTKVGKQGFTFHLHCFTGVLDGAIYGGTVRGVDGLEGWPQKNNVGWMHLPTLPFLY
jgi:hypothetical protein